MGILITSEAEVIVMNKKNASATIYIIFFFVMFLAFAAFAVDGTIVFTNRLKLQNATETTALAAAAEFNSSTGVSVATIQNAAEDTFDFLKKDTSLTAAKITSADVDLVSKKVKVNVNMIAQPFFLAFLGVTGISLDAKATAISESLNVQSDYSGVINWVTASAAYVSDILSMNADISTTNDYNDTAILLPLGSFYSASYDLASGYVNFRLIDSKDGNPLSLGPGGFVTIKLPAPIVDKDGYDLYIKEIGALEGYMVFAGLDVDPTNPYVNVDKPGGGIYWVNISSCGTSDVAALSTSAHQTSNNTYLGSEDKFYGSGNFDIGACGISMAKYIRIVDDNEESAFVKSNDNNYYKAMLYGEASTATSGADIDEVVVLNHVKLVSSS